MKVSDRAAYDKIIRARTNLLVSNGFFGFLAMHLKLVEATEHLGAPIPTMATDGVSMYYNPEFVHKLSEREQEGVLAHEVMHSCFQQCARRGYRDPMIWNIAGDHVINNDLTEAGFTLPQPNCCDPKYKGMTTEEVYDLVEKDAVKITIKISGGKGDGKGNPDPGGCGGVLDAPGDAGSAEATKQTWETSVRAAIAVARANNAGNIPGSLSRLLADLNKPKVSWRDLTRNFIDQSMTKDTSWSRISRRSTALGTLMPGLVSDRMQQLVFVADTSGSVSDALLKEFLSEVAGALDQGTADRMTVLYADARVHDVDEFLCGDLVMVNGQAREHSGGGTDFDDSFRWIRENAPDASCVVYLTDMQSCSFGEDPGCPVLWAIYGSNESYAHWSTRAGFGTSIHVSNSYG